MTEPETDDQGNVPAEGTITSEDLAPAEGPVSVDDHPGEDRPPTSKGETPATVKEIAQQVREGKWGVRKVRRQRLIDAGYDYKEVQAELHKK